ncbi:MAG: DUF2254 domain-containing protein [Deltaproteobacteria bacterium]|nr:DUF2254 domain-containing protein [Deltaproteobacteria bacterium]
MRWDTRSRLRRYLRDALWVEPLIGLVLGVITTQAVGTLERSGALARFQGDTAGFGAVLSSLNSALLTSAVFVFSMLLLVVQLASAQLTPRIIARAFREPVTKVSLGIFLFMYTYSLGVIGRMGTLTSAWSLKAAIYGSVLCLAVFLFLINRLGQSLRPVAVVAGVAEEGREVIASVYPVPISAERPLAAAPPRPVSHASTHLVRYAGRSGVLLEFDVDGLVALAARLDCVLELVPQVGDFVATGDDLFRVYGAVTTVPEAELRRAVALGPERTMEQDPAFAFRIIVDIASKALSPAINDPTTAVLALDQLHHLLREVGLRHLDSGELRDREGRVRVRYHTPDWEDFVMLAVTEIRQFGRDSIQVARRLRAMLEGLIPALPPERGALLAPELDLLKRTAERAFTEPEDRSRAGAGDFQGLGSHR